MVFALTLALLTLPVGSSLTLADTVSSSSATTGTTTVAPPLNPTVPTTVSPATSDSTTSSSITIPPVVDSNGNTVAPENWFTDLIGKIQLLLTFNPINKASIEEHHALAKLAEANKLLQQGKPDAAEASLSQYTDKITQAQNFINQVKDPNSQEAKTLAIALSNVNTNNIKVLSGLLDKLPPQAAQRLALNIVSSMEKAVSKASSASNTTTTAPAAASTSQTTADPAAVNSNTTSTSAVTSNTKALEKQADTALENFKKSLKQKKTLPRDDQDQDEDNHGTQQVQIAPQASVTRGTMMTIKGSANSEHRDEAKGKNGKENHRDD